MNKWLFFAAGLLIIGGLVFFSISPKLAFADFNANNLMDDAVFDNNTTMTASQIDAWLNSFGSSCISSNSGFRTPDPAGWSAAVTSNHGYTFGGNVTAGQAIYDTSQIYHVNPQVILATMQKEQSVITGGAGCHYSNPSPGMACTYSGGGCVFIAMSYACPGGCDYSYNGFSLQLIAGTWLLRFGEQRAYGNLNNYPGHDTGDENIYYSGPMTAGVRQRSASSSAVTYDGSYTTQDGTNVTISNGPTATLYWYTPFISGNQSFVNLFESWFGSVHGGGYVLAVDQTDNTQWVIFNNIRQYVPSADIIQAWGLPSNPVSVSHAYITSIQRGPDLGRLLHIVNSPDLYFADGGKKYKVTSPQMRDAFGFTGQVESYVSYGLYAVPHDGGNLTFDVKNTSNTAQYMVDGLNNSGQVVLRQYSSPDVEKAWEGDNVGYTTLSDTYFATIDNAVGTPLTNTKITFNGSEFQVIAGQRMAQPSSVAALYPGVAQSVTSYTYNRLVPTSQATHLIRSTNSPDVYLLDVGVKHHILSSDVLTAWSFPSMQVNIVDDGYINLITAGSDLNTYLADTSGQLYVMSGQKVTVPTALDTAYRKAGTVYSASSTLTNLFPTASSQMTGFLKGANTPQVYLVDNSGQRRHITSPDALNFFGGYQTGVSTLPDAIVNTIPPSTDLSAFVTDGTTQYVIDAGQKWSVSAGTKTAWGLGTAQTYSDGTLDRFSLGGVLGTSIHDGSNYYLIRSGTSYLTVDPNIANTWGISSAASHNSKLLSNFGVGGPYMLTRFVQSSASGDNRTFMIDAGNWYNLSSAQRANLGSASEPTMLLDPSLAPNTITDWASVVVQDSVGVTYVIDGGGKRSIANSIIKNQWTGNGSLTVPSMSNGFLDLLPNKGTIERAIKGSAPAVYLADTGTKRWILSGTTYQQSYAPFANVTDQLLTAMPSGSNIP